jgi:hypothetical protein
MSNVSIMYFSSHRCHCMFKNGTYINGPFYYEEDPVGAVITHVACNPGKIGQNKADNRELLAAKNTSNVRAYAWDNGCCDVQPICCDSLVLCRP